MARKIRRRSSLASISPPSRYRPAQFAASTNRIPVARVFGRKEKKEKGGVCEKSRGDRAESCVRSFFGVYGRSFLRWFFVILEREKEREIWSEIKVDLLGLIFGI